jgi:hypothetical protein
MRLLKALLPVALVLAGAGSTGAADPPAGDELLAVGATGIYCLRAPCPWRGIRALVGRNPAPDRRQDQRPTPPGSRVGQPRLPARSWQI